MKLNGCRALITGASAGLGWECAMQLASRAATLMLVARRGERLEKLKSELVLRHPNLEVHARVTDLSHRGQIEQLCQWLEQKQIALDLLVNNAGLGDIGPFPTSDPNRIEQMIRVNIAALTLLTRALLPMMLARKHGAILNVSSSASFLPMPGFAVYAATKAYVTNFTEAIRAETRGSGITVTALCPGPVRTEFQEIARRSGDENYKAGPEMAHVSAKQVIRDALEAVEADRAIVIPGLLMKIGMALIRLTPMPLLRRTLRFWEK